MSRRFVIEPCEGGWALYLGGRRVTDERGQPWVYGGAREAWRVAEDWQAAPTYAELRALPEPELRRRAGL